ncbi:hypothetical protein [Haladaptatus pallidirubidus]|uniref:Uncharacterized protein n=1 Tax=Haladaptatus pallidirubidus TaxID=1008152 RepID=A0AAV3UQJ9_9EURY|nr:hypothetical protein [Haladaptatus pallidirubidus]
MENETGCTLAKYEAKFVEDGEMEYIDKEIVLVKKTNSFGGEKMYFVPKEVIETVPHLLPQLTYLGMRALVIEIHRGNQQLKS